MMNNVTFESWSSGIHWEDNSANYPVQFILQVYTRSNFEYIFHFSFVFSPERKTLFLIENNFLRQFVYISFYFATECHQTAHMNLMTVTIDRQQVKKIQRLIHKMDERQMKIPH